MKREWRSSTVVAMCLGIRQTNDYSSLPILADALQDAGCDDEKLLFRMRDNPEPIEAQRIVAILNDVETEDAVRAIEELAERMGPRAFCEEGDGYGKKVPMTYARLIRVGLRFSDDYDGDDEYNWGGMTTEHGSEDLRDDWRPADFDEFWAAFKLITGTESKVHGNPFSCSC